MGALYKVWTIIRSVDSKMLRKVTSVRYGAPSRTKIIIGNFIWMYRGYVAITDIDVAITDTDVSTMGTHVAVTDVEVLITVARAIGERYIHMKFPIMIFVLDGAP